MNPFEYFRNLKETLTKEDPIYIDESSEGVLDFIGLYKEVRLDIFDCEKVIERIDRIYQSINNEYQLVPPYHDKIFLYNLSEYESTCIKYHQLMNNI